MILHMSFTELVEAIVVGLFLLVAGAVWALLAFAGWRERKLIRGTIGASKAGGWAEFRREVVGSPENPHVETDAEFAARIQKTLRERSRAK